MHTYTVYLRDGGGETWATSSLRDGGAARRDALRAVADILSDKVGNGEPADELLLRVAGPGTSFVIRASFKVQLLDE
jgi:hypothetical protein